MGRDHAPAPDCARDGNEENGRKRGGDESSSHEGSSGNREKRSRTSTTGEDTRCKAASGSGEQQQEAEETYEDAVYGGPEDDRYEDAQDGPFPSMIGGDEEDADVAPQNVNPTLMAVLQSAESGDAIGLQAALKRLDCSLDALGPDGDTALHLACLYGHKACVKVLLDAGADVNSRDEDSALPMHDACASGFADIAEMLLEKAGPSAVVAIVNAPDSDGDTPLHNASRAGHKDVVRLLLKHGANPEARNSSGETPAMLCEGSDGVLEHLQQAH